MLSNRAIALTLCAFLWCLWGGSRAQCLGPLRFLRLRVEILAGAWNPAIWVRCLCGQTTGICTSECWKSRSRLGLGAARIELGSPNAKQSSLLVFAEDIRSRRV